MAPQPALAWVKINLQKMMAEDNPQAFVEAFEAAAVTCAWPAAEWAVSLLPLLSGEAQRVAHSLPSTSRGNYHRRWFRQARLGSHDQPFAFAQRLLHAASRWLCPAESFTDQLVERVVLEQFVEALPVGTASWVSFHRPRDLATAIALAEDHLAVWPPNQHWGDRTAAELRWPTPVPCKGASPPPGRGPVMVNPFRSPINPFSFSPAAPPSPSQSLIAAELDSTSQRAAQMSEQVCWRCGQPSHLCLECPLMEIGQVVRVASTPVSSPCLGGTNRVPVRI